MTDVLDGLRTDQIRWRTELVDLVDPVDLIPPSDPVAGADTLLFRLRSMVAICRRRILPRLAAQRELIVPAAVTEADCAVATGYPALLEDALGQVVHQLELLQPELLQYGATSALRLRIAALLATAAAMSTLALRYGSEVLMPQLEAELTWHEREQLVDAVHAFERTYR